MDKLSSMNVFVKSADLGSFAAAAAVLNISPQMVAKHIASLEHTLGSTLLNRTTRRQSLTEVGRAYYDRCKIVLSEVQAADSLVDEIRSEPQGILRVSAPVTFGAFSMLPFITRFLTQYPAMQIDLSLNDRFVDPLEEGFEVMIRIGQLADSSLIARALAPYKLIACASPGYLAARGVPKIPAELVQHECLAYANWSPSMPCVWSFTRDGKTEEISTHGRFSSNNWKALLHAATEGLGITLGPEKILAVEVAAGRLVRVLPDYEGPARPMHVLYPPSRRPTIKLRSFVEAMLEEFGPSSY